MRPDPYRVLELSPGASLADVKRAYRRLAKASHPDAVGPRGVGRFLAVQTAYHAILDAYRRGERRAETPAPDEPAAGPGSAPPPGWARARRGGSRGEGPEHGPSRTRRADEAAETTEERARRKARLGTTSYDEAVAFEPQWEGASWYGEASGTYWTINPREFADPRKHGPEYLARARGAHVVGKDWREELEADAPEEETVPERSREDGETAEPERDGKR